MARASVQATLGFRAKFLFGNSRLLVLGAPGVKLPVAMLYNFNLPYHQFKPLGTSALIHPHTEQCRKKYTSMSVFH